MAEEGNLPPRDVGWAKAAAPMEHKAPTEILPVENMKNKNAPQSSQFIKFLLQLLLLLRQLFATIFMFFFLSPRG